MISERPGTVTAVSSRMLPESGAQVSASFDAQLHAVDFGWIEPGLARTLHHGADSLRRGVDDASRRPATRRDGHSDDAGVRRADRAGARAGTGGRRTVPLGLRSCIRDGRVSPDGWNRG